MKILNLVKPDLK